MSLRARIASCDGFSGSSISIEVMPDSLEDAEITVDVLEDPMVTRDFFLWDRDFDVVPAFAMLNA